MKKLLATLLVSTMALSAFGGLVACGGGDDDGAGKQSDYYLVGASRGSLFAEVPGGAWHPIGRSDKNEETEEVELTGASSRKELDSKLFFKTTSKANVYTITVDLFKGDKWCICDAQAGEEAAADETFAASCWANQVKFYNNEMNHATADEYIVCADLENNGTEGNFQVAKSGRYTITLDTKGGEYESALVTWKRVSDPQEKLETASYEWVIMGDGDALNAWGAEGITTATDAKPGTVFDKKNGANELKINLTKDQFFKFTVVGKGWGVELNYSSIEAPGDDIENDGGNIKIVTGGEYTFIINEDGDTVTYSRK